MFGGRILVNQTAVHAQIDLHLCSCLHYKEVLSVSTSISSWLTHWWLCFLTEWHQLSVDRWQRHGVHTLGRSRRRWRLCGGRVCVHGRERWLAEGWLWNSATRSPVSRSPTKSVLLHWNLKIWALDTASLQLFRLHIMCENTHHFFAFSSALSLTGSKPFVSYEFVCPSTWVKFGHGCYNFESVVQKLTFEEAREHCRQKGRDS